MKINNSAIFNPFGVELVLVFAVPPVSPVVIRIKAFQAFWPSSLLFLELLIIFFEMEWVSFFRDDFFVWSGVSYSGNIQPLRGWAGSCIFRCHRFHRRLFMLKPFRLF